MASAKMAEIMKTIYSNAFYQVYFIEGKFECYDTICVSECQFPYFDTFFFFWTNLCILIDISLKFVPNDLIDNKPSIGFDSKLPGDEQSC